MKTIAKPIKMICLMNEEGRIEPLKFKIESKSGEMNSIKVLRVQTSQLQRIAGSKVQSFTCDIEINQAIRLCEIRYNQDQCTWVLFKV